MKNLKTIKIKNDLWELRESEDCIIKTKVKDGHYTNYYNLFKQDNIVIEGVEEKEPNPAILEKTVEVGGQKSKIYIHAARIPFVFEDDDEITSQRLREALLSLL